MSWTRIWAVFLRYFYFFFKMDSLAELFFWPGLDIFLWGVMGEWITETDKQLPMLALTILTGLIFWQMISRCNDEIAINLLNEFWNRNLVNLFSTPLKFVEWGISLLLYGLFKVIIALFFGAFLAWVLYALNIFTIGWAFLPFVFSLTISGWIMGYFSAGILIYFGQRVQMLAWMTNDFFAPFCAIFYPLSALPLWAQSFGKVLPMTYVFEGMRLVIQEKNFSTELFMHSLYLNFFYLIVTIFFFSWMFKKSLEKGLARLE